jgi:Fe-S-cluster-containing hydrogenase component 2/CRP-like cAMP-binding protein
MVLINIPNKIEDVADDLQDGDELFSVYELQELKSVQPFKGMKPGAENFPGAMILRRCVKGRILCRQGEEGATAFQILTRDNALKVVQAQLRAITAEEAAFDEAILQAERDLEASVSSAGNVSPEKKGELRAEIEKLKERSRVTRIENQARRKTLELEVSRLEAILGKSSGESPSSPREVARARLIASSTAKRKGLLHRLVSKLLGNGGGKKSDSEIPDYIPNDGPQDLDTKTLSAPMFEGDLFGEMSCMNLAPRSATVIATEGQPDDPVYMIEMVRNALDALRGNAEYRKQMDQIYRSRVMETQVRSLPLFRVLSDDDYKWLASKLELVEFEAGDVIFDEHDSTATDCYVVRTGVVKVSQNLGCLLGADEVLNSGTLCRELAACRQGSSLAAKFWNELPSSVQKLASEITGQQTAGDAEKETLRQALNSWMQKSRVYADLGTTTPDVIQSSGLAAYASVFEDFQEKTADWWVLEVRIFNRMLLESFCPSSIRKRSSVIEHRRTLSYASRGEIIGEMAVLCKEDRSATCLAFTHPSSGQKTATQANLIPQRVEAVRISGDVLQDLRKKSPRFRDLVDAIVAERRQRDVLAKKVTSERRSASQTKEFDELGLAWGQSLMVIDLDRCTRCNECVKACVDAHDDGRTRLYLDGPRFENKYLIPVTCRKCLDPVCMIGCPVGAINRGGSGEIQIADHCIGCSKCADQCPYGSIQMDLLDTAQQISPDLQELLGPGFSLRTAQEKAVVCDQCSSTPTGQPSCVYACPHDAAVRVEGLLHFNSQQV